MNKTSSICLAFLLAACGSPDAPLTNKETPADPIATSAKETIPDTIVQFLITSAAADFRDHHPPTAVDFRNVKIGYIKSADEVKFVLCGEFLSKEKMEWLEFTTIKTSGYEQYIGKTQYCQDATMVLTNESLYLQLKQKLGE